MNEFLASEVLDCLLKNAKITEISENEYYTDYYGDDYEDSENELYLDEDMDNELIFEEDTEDKDIIIDEDIDDSDNYFAE